MFLQFLGGLVIFGFSFRILVTVVLLPLNLLRNALARNSELDAAELVILPIAQALLSVVYAAFLALITLTYVENLSPEHPWLYGVFGFVFTFFALSSNAASKLEQTEHGHLERAQGTTASQFIRETQEREAIAFGAGVGFLVGLVAFPIAYTWPQLIAFVPGTASFFTLCVNLGLWLTGFWVVNLIIVFVMGSYIFSFGANLLFAGVMLVYGLWSGIRAMLGRLVGSKRVGDAALSTSETAEEVPTVAVGMETHDLDDEATKFERQAIELASQGALSASIASYKEVIRCDPGRLHVYEELMRLYAHQGDHSAGAQQFDVLADYYRKKGDSQALARLRRIAIESGIDVD